MSFKQGTALRSYFSKLDKHSSAGKLESLWDRYYLCFMVGALHQRLGDEPDDTAFVDHFIREYQPQRHEILATLAAAEIQRRGISWEDDVHIQKLMLKLLKSDDPTGLSEEGARIMNQYVQGGFEILKEKISDPRGLDDFLDAYVENFATS